MATVKEARKKSLLQFLALIIAVAVIVVGVVLFQSWWNSRPGTAPQDVTIKASVGDHSLDIKPYIACEVGTDCTEGEVPNLTVGDDGTLQLEIPEDISNHEWVISTFYDDPAANDQTTHGANETTEVELPGSVDPIEASTGKRPRLMIVEISAMMLGTDANGEDSPFQTVWSLSTMAPEELAKATASNAASAAASPSTGT